MPRPLNVKALRAFETPGTANSVSKCHVLKGPDPYASIWHHRMSHERVVVRICISKGGWSVK